VHASLGVFRHHVLCCSTSCGKGGPVSLRSFVSDFISLRILYDYLSPYHVGTKLRPLRFLRSLAEKVEPSETPRRPLSGIMYRPC
jgi:hypothetical protein